MPSHADYADQPAQQPKPSLDPDPSGGHHSKCRPAAGGNRVWQAADVWRDHHADQVRKLPPDPHVGRDPGSVFDQYEVVAEHHSNRGIALVEIELNLRPHAVRKRRTATDTAFDDRQDRRRQPAVSQLAETHNRGPSADPPATRGTILCGLPTRVGALAVICAHGGDRRPKLCA